MSEKTPQTHPSRRDFIKDTSRIATASILGAGLAPRLYAGENNTINVALVGCGGRGSGAAGNALSVKNGPIKLVAWRTCFPGVWSVATAVSRRVSLRGGMPTAWMSPGSDNSSGLTLTKRPWTAWDPVTW